MPVSSSVESKVDNKDDLLEPVFYFLILSSNQK